MKTVYTDVVIVGAGPVGLFQAFELGLQGLSVAIFDSRDTIGGQCSELYPDKIIYDIPALPSTPVSTVIENLKLQCAPFEPLYCLSQTVLKIDKIAEHHFIVHSSNKTHVNCKAVVVAAGNGAFEPVKLKVDNIDKFAATQLHYGIVDQHYFANKDVVILGGGELACNSALSLQGIAKSVLLVHRSENFRASAETIAQVQDLRNQAKIRFIAGQVLGFEEVDNKLQQIRIKSKTQSEWVKLDDLLVCFGLTPKLDAVKDWGLAMQDHQICVDTANFQSSMQGIYAIGDICTYKGKRKLILSGFHEAAMVAYAIKQAFEAGNRINTKYTTNSSELHKRLGV